MLKCYRKLFIVSLLFAVYIPSYGIVYRDENNEKLEKFFSRENAKYIIRYKHVFKDTLVIPINSELVFEGGSLSGPIYFNNSELSGNVNLKGSSIAGSVKNKMFDASWLCNMDGKTDDAICINEMIQVCGNVCFPKGEYRLLSSFDANGMVSEELFQAVKAHIGINKSNVSLTGEYGAIFITDEPMGTICVFSQPHKIEHSINNIVIDNITFNVNNDGQRFYDLTHTIKIIGANGVVIKNSTFNDFWGDAICLSHYGDNPRTGERTRNTNVKILNNTIIGGYHHNNRNGISIISGKNVLIKGNTIRNTSRSDMPGGIDVEPNNPAFTIENIRIEKNVLDGIKTSGICVVVMNGSPAKKIAIIDNIISNSGNGILLYIDTENTSEDFQVKGNIIDRNTNPVYFKGKGVSKKWNLTGNTFGHSLDQKIPGEIKVKNLKTKKNKKN